jgi:hypothetical protein
MCSTVTLQVEIPSVRWILRGMCLIENMSIANTVNIAGVKSPSEGSCARRQEESHYVGSGDRNIIHYKASVRSKKKTF